LSGWSVISSPFAMDLIEVKTMRSFYLLSMEQSRIVSILILVSVVSILPVSSS
jgi:hypothetical protein